MTKALKLEAFEYMRTKFGVEEMVKHNERGNIEDEVN
ncbi:unnamed protein product [Linum tenue]|uniref:Uncharacterized protein n=1 Tax=Linum tenue TaxID=586396 RepID=A0AAV0I920_9ROSI|nr:unnamed protein product [Linum tenue]